MTFTACLLLALVAGVEPPPASMTSHADFAPPAATSSCPTDTDLSEQLADLKTHGPQALWAAKMIAAYQSERVSLCTRLDARGDMLTALRESLELTRQMLDLERAMRAMYQHDLAEALKRRAPARRRLFACVTGGAAGASIGGEGFAGPAVACGWPLF